LASTTNVKLAVENLGCIGCWADLKLAEKKV